MSTHESAKTFETDPHTMSLKFGPRGSIKEEQLSFSAAKIMSDHESTEREEFAEQTEKTM